ncbi:KH domain-containing protein family [Quillaja saponaria]|uniref:KH domain-containing protein family n=1 Tax=Quillaja saponaria TaxID=32244 RepID=A0AAD7KQ96_QUISA|nr:KH domain-containing protein family [Quillaja saponaria]
MILGGKGGDEYEGEEREEVKVTTAQEAMIRVFERVWELEAENEIRGKVTGKLLAHTSQIGAVLGKGGNRVQTIRNYSGANIRVLPPPLCGTEEEELIQITGDILAVKKALIAVSSCLQDHPPLDKARTSLSRPIATSPLGPSPDIHTEFFPHLTSRLPPVQVKPVSYASQGTTSSKGGCRGATGRQQEVVFRLLVSNKDAGSLIGHRGTMVRALQNETGASIIFAAPTNEFGERIVTISALEKLECRHSPAQNAVVLVFVRTVEGYIQRGFLSVSSTETPISARLLVAPDIAGWLSGNGGQVITQMRNLTGAEIQILQGEKGPRGASENDVVLQITGSYKRVEDALFQVTGSIRNNILSGNELSEVIPRRNLFTHHASAFPSMRSLPQNAGAAHARDLELGRGNKLATVTNTTVEIVIAKHVFGTVHGEDGENLERIRQISGAKVEVHDPSDGETEGRVVISGTPDQTFAAQSLLQAFIQTTDC